MLLGALEQYREHHPRFEAGQRSTDAEVDVTPERHVAARPAEDDLIGMLEHCRIPVGGAPEQQHRGAGRNIHIAQSCVPGALNACDGEMGTPGGALLPRSSG